MRRRALPFPGPVAEPSQSPSSRTIWSRYPFSVWLRCKIGSRMTSDPRQNYGINSFPCPIDSVHCRFPGKWMGKRSESVGSVRRTTHRQKKKKKKKARQYLIRRNTDNITYSSGAGQPKRIVGDKSPNDLPYWACNFSSVCTNDDRATTSMYAL